MSTLRSLKIWAIRWMLIPLRCASRISSLHSLKASIFADLRCRPPFELRATWTRYAAADLRRLGSGSVKASQGVRFKLMIKKRQIGDQIQDHNRGELAYHPEAFSCRDLD